MEDIKDYQEYEQLFNDDLVVAVRAILRRIDNGDAYNLQDEKEHNALVEYFNKFGLHRKLSKSQFQSRK